MVIRRLGVVVALAAAAVLTLAAQRGRGGAPSGAARAGTLERVAVRDREVLVYLPPSYATDAMRRYPVVYLLAERPVDKLKLPEAADRLASAQGFSEPIVVLPDVSAAGDPEGFVADTLVAYVDGRYRTMAARISRGLAGYSLGGDGALRIAMKRPETFSSLHLLSASVANVPVATLDASAASLQRYYAVALEIGTKDALLASNRQLHDALTRLRIPHYYEEFEGGHEDRAAELIATRLLPFFSRNLSAPANPTSPAVQ